MNRTAPHGPDGGEHASAALRAAREAIANVVLPPSYVAAVDELRASVHEQARAVGLDPGSTAFAEEWTLAALAAQCIVNEIFPSWSPDDRKTFAMVVLTAGISPTSSGD
jgi:hypothetical protein